MTPENLIAAVKQLKSRCRNHEFGSVVGLLAFMDRLYKKKHIVGISINTSKSEMMGGKDYTLCLGDYKTWAG